MVDYKPNTRADLNLSVQYTIDGRDVQDLTTDQHNLANQIVDKYQTNVSQFISSNRQQGDLTKQFVQTRRFEMPGLEVAYHRVGRQEIVKMNVLPASAPIVAPVLPTPAPPIYVQINLTTDPQSPFSDDLINLYSFLSFENFGLSVVVPPPYPPPVPTDAVFNAWLTANGLPHSFLFNNDDYVMDSFTYDRTPIFPNVLAGSNQLAPAGFTDLNVSFLDLGFVFSDVFGDQLLYLNKYHIYLSATAIGPATPFPLWPSTVDLSNDILPFTQRDFTSPAWRAWSFAMNRPPLPFDKPSKSSVNDPNNPFPQTKLPLYPTTNVEWGGGFLLFNTAPFGRDWGTNPPDPLHDPNISHFNYGWIERTNLINTADTNEVRVPVKLNKSFTLTNPLTKAKETYAPTGIVVDQSNNVFLYCIRTNPPSN